MNPYQQEHANLIASIRAAAERDERVLVTTLTKKMSEDLTDYLLEAGIRTRYLHSEVDTLRRIELLRELRLGQYDVLVGINLLREGLDLPEVSLVAILDADKEGFLRSGGSLIQVIGRAARNIGGRVLMYADRVTDSMRAAIDEVGAAGRMPGDPDWVDVPEDLVGALAWWATRVPAGILQGPQLMAMASHMAMAALADRR